jgi:16S rRNA (adenine1518-N6/adenine1519-N6)-dimethyltransferase
MSCCTSGLRIGLRLFEIDHGIIRILQERYGDRIPLVAGDFLRTFSVQRQVPAAIVGNLPYQSAGAMVPRVVEQVWPVPVMVFLLQSEMVDRLTAEPGSSEFSALTVLIRNHYTVERAFSVPAGAFYPRPHVASAVAVMRAIPDRPDGPLTAEISRLARVAFGQRRKTLRNSLRPLLAEMERCGIDPALRPERLSPEQFRALARAGIASQPIP